MFPVDHFHGIIDMVAIGGVSNIHELSSRLPDLLIFNEIRCFAVIHETLFDYLRRYATTPETRREL